MTLGELITALEAASPDRVVRRGLDNPHSYRGYYEDLAFEISAKPMPVSDILILARGSLGETFEGFKGGDNLMGADTNVWIAEYGSGGGETLGPLLLEFLLGDEAPAA